MPVAGRDGLGLGKTGRGQVRLGPGERRRGLRLGVALAVAETGRLRDASQQPVVARAREGRLLLPERLG